MSNEFVQVIPDSHLILALCNQSLTTRTALCEWIDNSLDAEATRVLVTFRAPHAGAPSSVSVEDDGIGKADLLSFARLGAHERSRSTRSGKYGVGAKDAAMSLGGEASTFKVTSTHAGRVRMLAFSWKLMSESNWLIPCQTEMEADPLDHPGTTVQVSPVDRKVPEGAEWARLVEDIAYTYTPAIKRGVQIKIQSKRKGAAPEILMPWSLPPLQPGHVDTVIHVDGKRARVYAGIVREGVSNTRPGLTYMHGFRVIGMASANGCGSYAVTRIAGFVEIDDAWSRNKNKDGIQNPDALYAAVEAALKDVLERAAHQGSQLRSEAFVKTVEHLINASINDAKARRGKGESKGTKEPRDTGRRHRNAQRKQPGDRMPFQRAGAISIAFEDRGEAEGAGYIQSNGVVVLNTSAPAIAAAERTGNALAVAIAACSIIACDRAVRGEDATIALHFGTAVEGDHMVDTFGRVLGRLLSTAGIDGHDLAEAAQ